MYNDIKDVFEEYFKDIKFDNKLYQSLRRFRVGWVTKSPSYSRFLGGNLLGVEIIKYTADDDEELFANVLGIRASKLKSDIHSVKGINPDWKVSGNQTYLTLIYIMRGFTLSKDIPESVRIDAIREAYYIYAYKAISSLTMNYFTYPLKEAVAKAAYEAMSNRFILKKVGTWQKFFEYRSNDILKKGLHYDRLIQLNTEDSIRIANDLQGRIRDTFKYIYDEILKVISINTGAVASTSMIGSDMEGNETVLDIIKRHDAITNNVKRNINNRADFIKSDIIILLSSITPNLDKDMLVEVLTYLSNNSKELINNNLLERIVTVNIEYLSSKGLTGDFNNNLMDTIVLLKNYWSSSRIVSKEALEVKKQLNNIIKRSTKKKTSWVIATVNIVTIVYIFIYGILN